ncbi:Glycoprotein-N-acetylgalactosamine 3-beta-galactosyltransferase 1 [Strongyloides ratti]|uniref:N-acetylgalactosaminide beta-1,3-galactosyltransferase n=1 Tax=Strongyloides ratti TaxID=34506 RepID=A0A090LJU5_STRRB|nr:Glycoprotein-N-acetylgalactosamine 3-beta-galactosyltransferase 1 [Strongyloides ratti]CEF69988.1 Glycoprotein-N-acetylgalactosamine 3-beta-galactosyltransferase 1 [Strongyloides ratti]
MKIFVLIILFLIYIKNCNGKKNFIPAEKNHYVNYTNDVVFNKVAGELNNKVKVFCIFLTTPKNKNTRVIHQKKTWIKRCNAYIYASGKEDRSLPAIKAYKDDHYRFSYAKMSTVFKYVYKNYIDQYDWFLKIDCDTYVVMENLRMLLLNKNPNEHYYSGFQFNLDGWKDKNFHYHHGGSGYVMSKKTLSLLVTKGLGNKKYCRIKDHGFEDLEIGMCLYNLKVKINDGRDKNGKILYLPIDLNSALTPFYNKKRDYYLSERSIFKYPNGIEAMSKYPIAFHKVNGETMYMLEYLIYHLNVAGLRNPMLIPDNEDVDKESQLIMEKISYYSSNFYKN